MRRVYLIASFVIIILVIAAGYFFGSKLLNPNNEPAANSYQNNNNLPSGGNESVSGGALPPAPTAGVSDVFGVVAQNPVLDYFVDPKNNLLLIQPDGQVMQISGNAQTVLSSAGIENVIHASFSYDGQKILAIFGNPSSPQVSVFDVPKKTWTPISAEIKNPVWSPYDYQIAFFSAKDQTFEVLATLDLRQPRGTPRPLMQLHAQDLDLLWPAKDVLYVSEKPSSYAMGSLWRVTLSTRTIVPVFQDVKGLMTAWNSTADRGVLFAAQAGNRGGDLSFVDNTGKILQRFDATTLPVKCAFQKESLPAPGAAKSAKPVETNFVICGFPKNAQGFALNAQPDSYLEKDFWSADYFYKVNLGDGVIQNLLPDNPYALDAVQLKVLNKRLFFVNRYDKRLYTIAL